MARQEVNIGVEGNDGTGDSIRESFRKTNENFQELYAVFGQGGTIRFTSLSDTPDELTPNTIALVNDAGTLVQLAELASDSELDELASDTITFSYDIPGKLIISTAFTKMSDDLSPTLGGGVNANGNAIAGVGVTTGAADALNAVHTAAGTPTNYTIDDLVITKGYADRRYITSGLPVRIEEEPAGISQYTLTISRYIANNIEVLSHGYDSGINGTPFVFNAEDTDPTNLVSGTTYFIRFVDEDNFSLHTTAEGAASEDSIQADATKVLVSGTIGAGDIHTLTDAAYDADLAGNFLDNVAVPRKSVTRRQGDTMTGALYLHDHPGELAGQGAPNGSEDLQAASKYYVDNTSYSSPTNLFVSTNGNDNMDGVPSGKEGTSFTYAYRTINAAAQRAEEIIKTSPAEPGPYFQTITREGGAADAEIVTADVDSPFIDGERPRQLMELNKDYVIEETISYLAFTYPDFVYDIERWKIDTGLIIDAVALDIDRGLNANYLTRQAAERFYSTTEGRKIITVQRDEKIDSIQLTRDIIQSIFNQQLLRQKTISNVTRSAKGVVTTTTNHGFVDGEQVLFITDDSDLGISAGMVELDRQTCYVKVLTDQTFEMFTDSEFEIPFDTSTFAGYTTGGILGVVYQTDKTLDLDAAGASVTTAARNAVVDKFNLFNNIIENGINAGADIVFGSTYKIVVNNGSLTNVDQASADNIDILPGKVVRGKRSGAIGQIVSLTTNDGTEGNNDNIQVHLLAAKDFEVGESLEYGNFVRQKQVTIFVESGFYEEDYPIRLAANVSLKGDEFRRVIIRPKNRVSQSPYATTYFFRDKEFDDLPLAETGEPFFNQSNELQGYFGYHYLERADRSINIGSPVSNAGDFTNSAAILHNNKEFIQEEVIEYLAVNYPALVYNEAKCRRDVALIIDALSQDLVNGGEEFSLEVQGEYYNAMTNGDYQTVLGDSSQEIATEAAIDYISTISGRLLVGSYSSGEILQDVNAADYVAPDLSLGSGETGTVSIVGNLIDKINFVFDVEYNPPKRNDQLDVFLMNDATIIRNVTVQGHGGFMCVLDPEGQILTKSPYIQTASSFSKSVNAKTFSGGMYVDAFVGNIPVYIPQTIDVGSGAESGKINNFTLWIRSKPGQGLFIRPPQLPCPFYVEGRRYQVNAISDYDSANGWCKIYLDADSNDGTGYDETQFANGLYYRDIFLQTAGNRSILGNDFTQINDLGYGLVVNNGAFSEMVSMFTYYTHAAYYANNGSEIRSLNGSNGYGNFGLVSEGADPNEIPDQVLLRDNMIQPVKAYTTSTYTNALDEPSITVTDMINPPLASSLITIDHGGVVGTLNYVIQTVENLSDQDNNDTFGESGDILVTGIESVTNVSGSDALRSAGVYTVQGTGGPSRNISNATQTNPVILTVNDHRLLSGSLIGISSVTGMTELNGNRYYVDVLTENTVALYTDSTLLTSVDGTGFTAYTSGGTTSGGGATFEITVDGTGAASVSVAKCGQGYTSGDTITVIDADLGNGGAVDLTFDVNAALGGSLGEGVHNNYIYKLDLRADDIQADDFFGTLQDTVANGTILEYRYNVNHIFDNVNNTSTLVTRPSTAINFDESDNTTYRSIGFAASNAFGISLPANQIAATFEAGFSFIEAVVSPTNLAGGNGSAQGDTKIAIQVLDAEDEDRITRDISGLQPGDPGYSGGMIFAWDGKLHQVVDYESDSSVAYISFNDVAGSNINASYGGTGLNSAIPAAERVLHIGLPSASTAEITVAISLCRATGHDFTQIGTGGFNDSNYPNVILGDPENSLAEFYTDSPTASSGQVWERRKGRVFFVSTDQFGFFRVGKFFSVDQATGDITFAGDVGLSNANSLGFKRGVTINEFSADDSMVDESGQAVPTEKAIVSYINRRLGYSSSGQILPAPGGNRIGPGFLPLNGISEMEANLQMGSNQITNLGLPGSDGTAATSKNYVDDKVNAYDELNNLRNIELNSVAANDLIVATGKKRAYVSPPSGGVWSIGNTISTGGNTGTIVDIEATVDEIIGSISDGYSVSIVTYTETAGSFSQGDVLTNGTAIATVLEDPVDEFANASEATASDINLTVIRNASNAEWNLQIEAGAIINADVNASAAIAQSKLAMNAATTRANATGISQSDRGLASFKDTEFTATNGFIELKTATSTTDGIDASKLSHIGTDTVLGRSSAGDGEVGIISFSTVLEDGGAVTDGDFPSFTGSLNQALIRTAQDTYNVADISDSATGDTIAIRKSSGAIQANSYIIGGSDTNEILSESAGVLSFKTPAQGVILTASGAGTPKINIPGILDIGAVGISSESVFQAGSSYTGESFIQSDWTYTSFIEAPGERDVNSTGIGIGEGTGFGGAAADVVQIITGGAVRVGISNTGVDINQTLNVDGNSTFIGTSTFTGNSTFNGSVTLGDANTDTLTVTARINSNVEPSTDNVRNLGASSLKWNTVYATLFSGTATTARYADLAEKYIADSMYEPGTVLVFGGQNEVTVTDTKGDRRIAGVVSTNPAYLMNSDLRSDNVVELALIGRVPCKVLGQAKKGDILVTSAIAGYAIVDNAPQVGTIIGKVLEDKLDSGKGVIEIAVGRV